MAFICRVWDFSAYFTITESGKEFDLQPVFLINLYSNILQRSSKDIHEILCLIYNNLLYSPLLKGILL